MERLLDRTRHDYWHGCGYRWLDVDADGQLRVTDDYLRHLLARPELAPLPNSCAQEVALHERLLESPRQAVSPEDLRRLRDADAADNYAVWLRFRDRLLVHPTLEGSYLALFQGQGVDVPPLLVHQVTQALLRHVLGDHPAGHEARAAEMLFRTQKISILEDGVVMAADDEIVERHAIAGGFGSLGELLKQGGAPLRSVDLDVLGPDNEALYWEHSEALDLAVSLNRGQPTQAALCRVLEAWIRHFLQVEVTIEPERQIDDEHWVWHVGLDAEASGVLNDLYQDREVSEDRMRRLLSLYRLTFRQPSDMMAAIAGRPVYLAMAMDANQRLKLKPQNLLLNLPLAQRS